MRHRSRVLQVAAIAALLQAPAAFAQDAGDSEVTDDGALGTIMVTAERREQSLQDVPISATVLSSEDLDQRGVSSINDLQNAAPSLIVNTYNRQTFVNIRGVGVNRSAPTTASGVAYYIDGVLVPNDKFIGFSFYDIDAIEVLRGPQGTLTGQNSTGGALFVRTPAPRFNSIGGYGEITAANYHQFKSAAALNLGGENVAVRLAGIHDQRDSFTDNVAPLALSQPGKYNLDSIRGTLRMRALDGRLDLTARGEYFDSRSDGNAVKNRFDAVTSDPFVIEEDAISFTNQEGHRLAGEARFDVTDAVQLRGIASWQSGTTNDQTDGDRTATALAIPAGLPASGANRAKYPARVSLALTDIDTFVAEVNLLSTGSGPFQWVVGGFLLDEGTYVELFRDNHSRVDFVSSDSDIITDTKRKSKSLFGQVSYYFTPAFEAVLGGRYSWDKQVNTRIRLPGPPAPPNVGKATSEEWTGKAALNYHLGNSLLYFSASKGYKAGGTNLQANSANFGPETNFVYELGAKTELFDRHLRLNGDVFYSDYRDIQFASLAGGLPLTQNAGRGKAWGAEFEALGSFGPALFNLGIGYLDAEFSRDACLNDTNSTITSAACGPGNRLVPKGDVLPYAPKWTLNAGVQFDIYASNELTVVPRLQWSHVGRQLATPFPSIRTEVPGRDLVDARLTFDFLGRGKVEAFVNNVFDETYIATQIQDASSADGGYAYGAPRTFGVRLRVDFGD